MTDEPVNPYTSTPRPISPADEKLWATLVHVGGVFIFFTFIPALVGFLVLGDRGPFVRGHTVTALNFQLTMLIAALLGVITTPLLIGFVILTAVVVLIVTLSIIAAVAANRGQVYTYPVTIRFVK
jgi:uncharacterized Tic20 family protein